MEPHMFENYFHSCFVYPGNIVGFICTKFILRVIWNIHDDLVNPIGDLCGSCTFHKEKGLSF